MSKRILVVEDHADNRQIIRDMLAPTDYEITEAENGEEALAAIAKQRPDLILMDTIIGKKRPPNWWPFSFPSADIDQSSRLPILVTARSSIRP